jgi:hypothetical protein
VASTRCWPNSRNYLATKPPTTANSAKPSVSSPRWARPGTPSGWRKYSGEPKSRLFYEFKVPVQSQCLVLEAFSVSHGKAHADMPLIDLLKSYFEVALEDDERKRREKVTGKVLALDRALEDVLPYLSSLLGITDPTSSLAQFTEGLDTGDLQDAKSLLGELSL